MVSQAPQPLPTLDRSQRRFFQDEARVLAVCWHRQKGKDFVTAGKAVFEAMRDGEAWYIVSLTQRQADATFDKCKEWAHKYKQRIGEIQVEEGAQYVEYDATFDHWFVFRSRIMYLPNGGVVMSLPGRNPDTIAGLTGNVIFTEFGLFPKGGYDHWRVVFPLATRGFKVICISTPRSKDTKFYELVSDPGTYSVHVCDIYQSVNEEGFVLRDQNGQPTSIENFRALYNDESGWKREYECHFIGELDPLLTWAQLELAGENGRPLLFDCMHIERNSGFDPSILEALKTTELRPEIGWDVARRGHLSSVWVNVGKPADRQLRFLILMRDCSFEFQQNTVRGLLNANGRSVGCGDATGLGMAPNEKLTQLFGDRWEGVNFAGTRKGELGSALATAFRDQTQTIPPVDGEHKYIATDLYSIQKQAVTSGTSGVTEDSKEKLKLVESENPLLAESHCDIAYSGALALRAGLHAVSAARCERL